MDGAGAARFLAELQDLADVHVCCSDHKGARASIINPLKVDQRQPQD